MTLELLLKRMAERGVSDRVMERVAKLNPRGVPEGSRPRGYRRRESPRWLRGWVGNGEFIRKHGRDAWGCVPREDRRNDGRRQYITREAYLDHTWAPVLRKISQ